MGKRVKVGGLILLILVLLLFIGLGIYVSYMKSHKLKPGVPIVVSFTRHTFRGVSKVMPPPTIKISNLKVQDPVFSYGMDATPMGQEIAKRFAATAYIDGAKLALKAIQQSPTLAGHWSVIRTDLAKQRTFATAVSLYQGLPRTSDQTPVLVGCPTAGGRAVDALSTNSPGIRACVSKKLTVQEQHLTKQSILPQYIALANHLLLLLGAKSIISDSNIKQYFSSVKALSNRIEMSSDLGGLPLQYVLQNNQIKSASKNHDAVLTAMQLLGYSTLAKNANLESAALTIAKAHYLASLPAGKQEIIVTHDSKISGFLSSLGFISAKSKPNSLAIYPLETVTIAMDKDRVAVVRTRINLGQDGSMTGKAGFKSWIVWAGSRKAWNARIASLQNQLNHHQDIAKCVAKISTCQPIALDLSVTNKLSAFVARKLSGL